MTHSTALNLPDIDQQPDMKIDTSSLVMASDNLDQIMKFAEMMTKARFMIPAHLHNNIGDCTAITMQAMQWRMNPYMLAQKTFVIDDKLGYQSQLVSAVIHRFAPIEGRLEFEWYGEWKKIVGNYDNETQKNRSGHVTTTTSYKKAGWTSADEVGVGVLVRGYIKGKDTPQELRLDLASVITRESNLWLEDPRQQIAYLAQKRWANLYCPEIIMGVYTADEIKAHKQQHDKTPKANQTVKSDKKQLGADGLLSKLTQNPHPDHQNNCSHSALDDVLSSCYEPVTDQPSNEQLMQEFDQKRDDNDDHAVDEDKATISADTQEHANTDDEAQHKSDNLDYLQMADSEAIRQLIDQSVSMDQINAVGQSINAAFDNNVINFKRNSSEHQNIQAAWKHQKLLIEEIDTMKKSLDASDNINDIQAIKNTIMQNARRFGKHLLSDFHDHFDKILT